ncbi:Dityrosine transporter 1 [Emydomyces testavorans]|uniref:Dityrosine transporter 1 n=1 Tax=Emydomyces testavorans TaxID=2070801 RepID=A0AAF0DAY5_9EURO|nr:Dityrosine transporter 1 [Emydomyces testavorans]
MSSSPKDLKNSPLNGSETEMETKIEVSSPPTPPSDVELEAQPKPPPPPYTAFSSPRRTFILTVITVAGFFGPLAGNIYLPALPVLTREFNVSTTAMNITVSVFMLVFAFGAFGSAAVVSMGAGTMADVSPTSHALISGAKDETDHGAKKTCKGDVVFPPWSTVRSNFGPSSRRSFRRKHILEVDLWVLR